MKYMKEKKTSTESFKASDNTSIVRILCRPYQDYINYIRLKASYELMYANQNKGNDET